MQIKTNRINLLDKLSVVGKAIPNKSHLPVAEGIYLQKEGDNFILCGNNLEMAIKAVDKGIEGKGEGAIVLPKKFIEIVKQLPDSEVEIAIEDDRAEIKSGKSKFSLNCLSAEDFPLFDEDYKNNPFIEFEGKVLKDLVRKTTFCISTDNVRPAFRGVLMSNDEINGFVCVSSDTYRLAYYDKVQVNFPESFKILVPGKLLTEVGRVIKDDDDVKMYIAERNIVFTVNDYEISLTLLQDQYPNFTKVFPAEAQTKIKVNKQDCMSMLSRAELLVPMNNKMFSLSITDVLKAEAKSEIGRMNEELFIEVEGESLDEILLNAKFVFDGVKVIDGEELNIEFNGAFGPVVIKEEGFKYLVLPIKVNR